MFPGPNSMGVVCSGVGRALLQLMQFSAIFAMLALFATSVTPCYFFFCHSVNMFEHRAKHRENPVRTPDQ